MTPTEVNVPRHVALYREVCQHPECDTRRLACADVLDDIGDERVECPLCKGVGSTTSRWRIAEMDADEYGTSTTTCGKCKGERTVLDTANRDRAEFIRVQVEMAQFASLRDGDLSKSKAYARYVAASDRLLAAHPEWRKCPCPSPKCIRGRHVEERGKHGISWTCETCGGTGDLFQMWEPNPDNPPGRHPYSPRTVTFSRGFPDSVECTAADVWREERRDETAHIGGHRYPTSRIVTVPTEWARAVVRHTPVTRFVVTDFVPAESARHGGWWRWYAGEARDEVPQVVFDLLVGEYPSDWRGAALVPYWRSGAAARDALAVALGKWARAAAYPAVPGG